MPRALASLGTDGLGAAKGALGAPRLLRVDRGSSRWLRFMNFRRWED